jgi:hypothetical protein
MKVELGDVLSGRAIRSWEKQDDAAIQRLTTDWMPDCA